MSVAVGECSVCNMCCNVLPVVCCMACAVAFQYRGCGVGWVSVGVCGVGVGTIRHLGIKLGKVCVQGSFHGDLL